MEPRLYYSNYSSSIRRTGVKMYKINAMGFKEVQSVTHGNQNDMEKQGWRFETINSYKKKKR